MKSTSIRHAFLDFFQSKDHSLVPSSGLVPRNDPSLLFTSAGMVQFKDFFTGKQTPLYPKAVSIQKCLRAGGKHNDLDQVGYTYRHQTFFEMLGNFSFGDYFKEEAIQYAWHFLTKILELPQERLWVTVYHTDQEAASLWQKIAGLPEEKILKIASNDNFWSMGDTGPCGPCSEIFYDHGSHIPGGLPGTQEQEGDRYVELWNLVFMQFETLSNGRRIPLPKPCVDTGMGLERLTAVLQGTCDNFQTDILGNLIQYSCQLTGQNPLQEKEQVAHRIIADHLRSAGFLIAEGILPSNEGRGYVLRRIIRRALRFVHFLKGNPHHLARMVPQFIELMKDPYQELSQAQDLMVLTLAQEGERFESILDKGITLIDQALKQHLEGPFSGEKAFCLYDTHGVPLDLIKDVLQENHIPLDQDQFQVCLDRQKKMSKEAWVGSGENGLEDLWSILNQQYPPTLFQGYKETEIEGQVLALVGPDGPRACLTGTGMLVADQTSFYAQGGGQIGDSGWILGPSGKMKIYGTEKKGHLFVHHGEVTHGTLEVGQNIILNIDKNQRRLVQANHSATHLLHSALRHILGPHVTQCGSSVCSQRLRFDFTHCESLNSATLQEIENWVNEKIRLNQDVQVQVMGKEKALQQGAIALFGEKYDTEVRVVSMFNNTQDPCSVEFCGGTHVQRTGDIGLFKIISQGSVACGVRRIEALTGQKALELFQALAQEQRTLASLLKVSTEKILEKAQTLLAERPKKAVLPLKHLDKISTTLWATFIQSGTTLEAKQALSHLQKEISEKGICIALCDLEGKQSLIISSQDPLNSALSILEKCYEKSGLPRKGGGKADMSQGPWSGGYEELLKILKGI